jgi:hypothetical protein
LGPTGMAWNGGSRFWPVWNGLEWRKMLFSRLEWLGMEEIGFGLTVTAWNRGSRFWRELSCVIGHQMCHRRLPTTDFQ